MKYAFKYKILILNIFLLIKAESVFWKSIKRCLAGVTLLILGLDYFNRKNIADLIKNTILKDKNLPENYSNHMNF